MNVSHIVQLCANDNKALIACAFPKTKKPHPPLVFSNMYNYETMDTFLVFLLLILLNTSRVCVCENSVHCITVFLF